MNFLNNFVAQRRIWDDSLAGVLRPSMNTIEGKQFFKSEIAVKELILNSKLQKFSPPYRYIFVLDVDDNCLASINYDEQELDRFAAITINGDDLPRFNNCVNFIEQNGIESSI